MSKRKNPLVFPLTVALALLIGFGLSHATGWNFHLCLFGGCVVSVLGLSAMGHRG